MSATNNKKDVFNRLEEMIHSIHPRIEKRHSERYQSFSEFVYDSTPFVMLKEQRNFVGIYLCDPMPYMNKRQEELARPFSTGKGCIRVKSREEIEEHADKILEILKEQKNKI